MLVMQAGMQSKGQQARSLSGLESALPARAESIRTKRHGLKGLGPKYAEGRGPKRSTIP